MFPRYALFVLRCVSASRAHSGYAGTWPPSLRPVAEPWPRNRRPVGVRRIRSYGPLPFAIRRYDQTFELLADKGTIRADLTASLLALSARLVPGDGDGMTRLVSQLNDNLNL